METQSFGAFFLSIFNESVPLMSILMVILIILSAFFSMSETAISSSSESKLRVMIEDRKNTEKELKEADQLNEEQLLENQLVTKLFVTQE